MQASVSTLMYFDTTKMEKLRLRGVITQLGEGSRHLNQGPSVLIATHLGLEGEGCPLASTPHLLQQSLTALDQLLVPKQPIPKC